MTPTQACPCSSQNLQRLGGHWKSSGIDQHTFVFDGDDDIRTTPAVLSLVGKVAQSPSELTPLGSYNPIYNRPTINSLTYAKWCFEVNKPDDDEQAIQFEDTTEALRNLQLAVSVSGSNSCLFTASDAGIGIQFEQALFVEKHNTDIRLKESLMWPVPYTSAKRFVSAQQRKSFTPLLVYHPDGVAIAPVDLDTKLRGSIVDVAFTLHHHSLRQFDCDQFRARVKRIIVLNEGPGTPCPLRFNEFQDEGTCIGDGTPEDVWFATQTVIDDASL